MFRLSEALRSLEPENASRLRLALKFSREELILQQMKETQKLMREAQLSKAETEVREMLAKLEHLRRLLLAEDLDFQMKLARLRQMRETLGQLERIIKEEKRELLWSKTAVEQQTELERLRSKKPELEALAQGPKSGSGDGSDLAQARDQIAQLEKSLAAPEFQRLERDQARNRNAADTLAVVSARLGNSGVALQKDLIRSSGSMRDAEKDLEKTEAQPAADDQLAALNHLLKSQKELAQAIESLLVELRTELQTRILAELTEMHEMQVAIRESTEAQAPRVAQKSRTALVLLVGLSEKESELAERTEQLRALTEETEFGIALPTALRVLGVEMRKVQEWLKEGDASARTIALEKRIEEDLLGLAEAMRRLPPTTPPPPGAPLPTSDLRALERELNRLIAELKMIRLLQSRLNDDTVDADHGRPKNPPLSPDLRREIEALGASQEELRDTLKRVGAPLEPPETPQSDGASEEELRNALKKIGAPLEPPETPQPKP
jgi:hypothetical protein